MSATTYRRLPGIGRSLIAMHGAWEGDTHLLCVESFDFMERAQKDKKPFFINANICDPHRPFVPAKAGADELAGAKVYKPDQVAVPKAHEVFDGAGGIKDERTAGQVTRVVKGLVDFLNKLLK